MHSRQHPSPSLKSVLRVTENRPNPNSPLSSPRGKNARAQQAQRLFTAEYIFYNCRTDSVSSRCANFNSKKRHKTYCICVERGAFCWWREIDMGLMQPDEKFPLALFSLAYLVERCANFDCFIVRINVCQWNTLFDQFGCVMKRQASFVLRALFVCVFFHQQIILEYLPWWNCDDAWNKIAYPKIYTEENSP